MRVLLGVLLMSTCAFAQLPKPSGSASGSGGSGGSGVSYCAPASASGTTYTCAPSPALTSYAAGTTLGFVPDVSATPGAVTVNVNSLGAKAIKESDGSTNPATGDLVAGKSYTLLYDGTVFRITPLGGAPGGSAKSVQINNAGSFGGIGPVNNAVVSTDASGNVQESTALPNGTTAMTQSAADSSTKVATTAYVDTKTFAGNCESGLGDSVNVITAATYSNLVGCAFKLGATVTITGIWCFTDNAGSSTLNATNGAGTALLTGAITCTNSPIIGAQGTQSATTTIADGDGIMFTFVADGASKQTNWVVAYTR